MSVLNNHLKNRDALFPPTLGALVPWGTSPRPSARGGKPSGLPHDDFKIVTKYRIPIAGEFIIM
ncbi:MAG: hypothetical protein J4N30_06560, partial [Chloroflexi bacterium]|nr:hypothetical protein [Chloroflexota bacterium]